MYIIIIISIIIIIIITKRTLKLVCVSRRVVSTKPLKSAMETGEVGSAIIIMARLSSSSGESSRS